MKPSTCQQLAFHALLLATILLIICSTMVLAHTFNHYNELTLERQDRQLQSMATVADEGIAEQLLNIRESLRYIQNRRGFVTAEEAWVQTGDAADLIIRMENNLVTQNPVIHTVLAVKDDQIILNPTEGMNFFFPDGMQGEFQPCYGDDGSMYWALFEDTNNGRYAALVDADLWYAEVARKYSNDSIRLMLMDRERNILLHQWEGQTIITSMEYLTKTNCDQQAVHNMMESTNSETPVLLSYELTYPGDDFVHAIRMNIIPLEASVNGHFVVGLTSDYDEIITPIHSALIRTVLCGATIMAGVALLAWQVLALARQNQHRDKELEALIQRNKETQKLLERTTELAHHQRLETIGTLTASISHEFNNLLTPIMGYAILTLEGLPESCDGLADNVAEIYEASRKAKVITARLGELSRKNPESSLKPQSLHLLISKALQVARPAQPALVTTIFSEGEDAVIYGNDTQLSQLMLNLILNAYQAMAEKGGTLTVDLNTANGKAIVSVKDEGIGIPEDALARIFDPFFTTKESGTGTGLGLAIAQQVVQNHHGEIHVESSVGSGSTFTILFPLADPR